VRERERERELKIHAKLILFLIFNGDEMMKSVIVSSWYIFLPLDF